MPANVLLGLREHLRAEVDPDDPSLRTDPLLEVREAETRPARNVENCLPAAKTQPVDSPLSHRARPARDAVVSRCEAPIPLERESAIRAAH
jgi:hypothetical protein